MPHVRTNAATVLLLLMSGLLCGVRAAAPQISVGPKVQVTHADDRTWVREVILCADPGDANRLLALSHLHQYDGERRFVVVAAYTSLDGGRTWARTGDTHAPGKTAGDPACAYGPDGTAYFSSMVGQGSRTELYLYRSKNGGRTWDSPVVAPGSISIDRPYLAIDRTRGPHQGRIYANGWMTRERGINGNAQPGAIVLFKSRDHGASFDPGVRRALASTAYSAHIGPPVVLSDGTVVSAHSEIRWERDESGVRVRPDPALNPRNAVVRVFRSTDGGDTLSDAVTVSDQYYRGDWANTAIPILAVDPGSQLFKDRLYAVWPDTRTGRSQVLVAYSADKGLTWSTPRVVSDARRFDFPRRGPHALWPSIAVNRSGIVGVMWYDRRESPEGLSSHIRFTVSIDGGETFLPSTPISDRGSSNNRDALWVEATRVVPGEGTGRSALVRVRAFPHLSGHTAGLAADAAGRFHLLWVSETDSRFQAWTTAVTVEKDAIDRGSPELAGLESLSDYVQLHVGPAVYDRIRHTISVGVHLSSPSRTRLPGPFKLRVIAQESPLGTLHAVNADNGAREAGPVWDFATLHSRRELVFEVTDPRSSDSVSAIGQVLTFDAQILGTPAGSAGHQPLR